MMSTTAISEFSERIEKTIIGMEELLNINMEIGKSGEMKKRVVSSDE